MTKMAYSIGLLVQPNIGCHRHSIGTCSLRICQNIDIRTVKGLETESISGQRRVSLMNNHKQFRQLLAQCAKGQIADVL